MKRAAMAGMFVSALLSAGCGAAGHANATAPTGTLRESSTPTVEASAAASPSSTPAPSLTPPPTSEPTPTPTTTATGPPPVVPANLVIAADRLFFPSGDDTLELINGSGKVIATDTVPSSAPPWSVPGDGPWWVGFGPTGIFIDTSSGSLSALEPDGKVHALENIGAIPLEEMSGLAESPDGAQWIYSVVTWNSGYSESTSRLYVGSAGSSPRLVATLTRADSAGGGYAVLRWDATGVLLGTALQNVGGAGPFISEGYEFESVVQLDPSTGAISAPLTSSCRFSDVASDGTIACVSGTSIKVLHPDGTVTAIEASGRAVGRVAFAGDSSTLTYCVANDTSDGSWADTLYVVDLDAGTPVPKALSATNGLGNIIEGADAAAWTDVVSGQTLVATTDQNDPVATLINLNGGGTQSLGSVSAILGVLSPA
jgi:hypothetical protein